MLAPPGDVPRDCHPYPHRQHLPGVDQLHEVTGLHSGSSSSGQTQPTRPLMRTEETLCSPDGDGADPRKTQGVPGSNAPSLSCCGSHQLTATRQEAPGAGL